MNHSLPNIQFKLVSPEKVLYTGEASMVVLPVITGSLGVLYNHAPTVVTLGQGIIDVYHGENLTERLFVWGGFANVNETECIAMADDAVSVEDLHESEVQERIVELEDEIDHAKVEEEKQELLRNLLIAETKLEIIKRLKK